MCEYCKQDKDGYVKTLKQIKGNNYSKITADIYKSLFDGFVLVASQKAYDTYFKINYCPMCGRKLVDEC